MNRVTSRTATFFLILLSVACQPSPNLRNDSMLSSAVAEPVEVTIISSEQSALNRFRNWVDNIRAGLGQRVERNDVLTTFFKILPANIDKVPSSSEITKMKNADLCPLFVGDKITFELQKPPVVSGHIHIKLTGITRTALSQQLLESQSQSQASQNTLDNFIASTTQQEFDENYSNPYAGIEDSNSEFALVRSTEVVSPDDTPDDAVGQRRSALSDNGCKIGSTGYLFKEHLDPKDAGRVFYKNLELLYDESVGRSLAQGIQSVSCGRGMCLNCVFKAFEWAKRGSWPVHEDSSTINAGSCARSFADFWKESYESRMRVKRVWWGYNDSRNLIVDPYDLPVGSIVVWDVCGRRASCPGGPGYGDIGVIVEKSGRSFIKSWYPKISLIDQDRACQGKITGIWLPWSG